MKVDILTKNQIKRLIDEQLNKRVSLINIQIDRLRNRMNRLEEELKIKSLNFKIKTERGLK